MDERQDTPRKQLDLRNEAGISRRDLLRRGAVVGGTLVWVAPAIQSFGAKAYARVQGPSPGNCAACYCFRLDVDGKVEDDACSFDGLLTAAERFSADACDAKCASLGFPGSKYCSGTKPPGNCACTLGTRGTTTQGTVVCS